MNALVIVLGMVFLFTTNVYSHDMKSGSRIKRVLARGEDGSFVPMGWFDTKYETDCSFVPVQEETEKNHSRTYRCIPISSVSFANGVYQDSDCKVVAAGVNRKLFKLSEKAYGVQFSKKGEVTSISRVKQLFKHYNGGWVKKGGKCKFDKFFKGTRAEMNEEPIPLENFVVLKEIDLK